MDENTVNERSSLLEMFVNDDEDDSKSNADSNLFIFQNNDHL